VVESFTKPEGEKWQTSERAYSKETAITMPGFDFLSPLTNTFHGNLNVTPE
jgi:hypothetical protein